MHYEFPLVFFTVLTQLAVGMAVFAAFGMLRPAGEVVTTAPRQAAGVNPFGGKEWYVVAGAALLGLAASMLHLAQPWRAVTALTNMGGSWLSREGLVFGLFAALACLCCFKPSRLLCVLTAVAGLAGIIMQGMTYAVISMPAISNGVPMLLFALTSLSLGAAFAQNRVGVLRVFLGMLMAVLLIVPCVWASGGTIMQATAHAWLASPLFWGGLVLLGAAFGLTYAARQRACTLGLLVLCAVLLSRIVFFKDTIHTATGLGLPY